MHFYLKQLPDSEPKKYADITISFTTQMEHLNSKTLHNIRGKNEI